MSLQLQRKPHPQSTCAGDSGDVAGLADQILHDSQNPELIPGVLQPQGQYLSAKGPETATDRHRPTATDPAMVCHGTRHPKPWVLEMFNNQLSRLKKH